MGKNIAVVGLGYVGLPLALMSARKGYRVFGLDINGKKIEALRKGISPIADSAIESALSETKKGSIIFDTDFAHLKQAEIVVICVPTPVSENHLPDLGPVEGAAREVADNLQKGQLIILESTVNPGVSEDVVLPILEKISGLKGGVDFHLAHCPERINPGDPKWNVENIPRVLGSLHPDGLEAAHAFYSSIITGRIRRMASLKEAEAVKIVENSFRDINIAFVNELAMSFSRLGIDVVNVIDGAKTKPFGFMAHYPSCGVGGHCIPVDPYYLIDYAEKNGFYHQFLSLARRINNHMPEFTVEQLVQANNDMHKAVKGTSVVVLGLAYKPNIEDCRESPSFEIIKHLEQLGVTVRTYDPYVLSRSSAATFAEAVDGADSVIIATAHKEFRSLKPSDLSTRGVKVVIDGCNCLDQSLFLDGKSLAYRGIGR